MPRIISIVNQKGGVGKTTTAINVAAFLAQQEKKVLLIDLDPQSNATSGFGLDLEKLENSIYQVLIGAIPLEKSILILKENTLHLAPSNIDLAGGAVELLDLENREHRLHFALQDIKAQYDFIIIDCPPSLNILTVNSLVASSEIIIPVQAEYYALEGLSQLLNTINLIKENLNTDLRILGVVITMFEQRQRLAQEVWMELYKSFPGRIFRSVIPRNVKLAEAPSFGKSILDYSHNSKGARAYEKLVREIIENSEGNISNLIP